MERVEESANVDDAGCKRNLAFAVDLLIDGDAGGCIVEVDADYLFVAQCFEVGERFAGCVPVPGVEDEAHIFQIDFGVQLAHLGHGMEEGKPSGGPERFGADVLET